MPNLSTIAIARQKHPALAADNPFDIAWDYRYLPASDYLGDMHYALQLGICLTGASEIVYDGYSRICRPGECWWTMCWEPHAYRALARRSFTVAINLDLNSLGQCDPFGSCNWLLPFSLPPEQRFMPESAAERRFFAEAGRQLFHWHCRGGRFHRQQSWLLIHQLLLTALESLYAVHKNETAQARLLGGYFPRLRPAVELARAAGIEPVTLAHAAAACSLSPSRFSELFREAFGLSFGQFAARARLGRAAREVLHSPLTIEEIAARWGYFDSSHFCHAFKKVYQCSPSEFRLRKASEF